ncbi:MAG: hypothetical protein HUK20_00135 [Fibrobacter sp.]|nr:hypothetical protein [Fibrobacter sp.]
MKFSQAILPLFAALILLGCIEDKAISVNYQDVTYKKIWPIEVFVDSSKGSADFVVKKINLRYPVMVGDTLDVEVLEFQSDVYALDYYINSGHFQGSNPILRGDLLQQSIRADSKIFIFSHDSFRRYERGDLEDYVRSFPQYKGGFPQEFLSLPSEKRVFGKASIQTKYFLGVKSTFPTLSQTYQDAGLTWNVARSWDVVEPQDYIRWTDQLEKIKPRGIMEQNDCTYFTVGDGTKGISTQLAGGRVVIVWGYLGWFDLERKLFTASDRVFESRF